jgi:uncharacterized Zn-binding protein involved in type VI secretion
MASLADMHMCPMPAGAVPHGPGFVTKGSGTVLINNLPACRQNDKVMEACGGSDPIAMGCPTVLIGDSGGGAAGVAAGAAGAGAAPAGAAAREAATRKPPSPRRPRQKPSRRSARPDHPAKRWTPAHTG